MWTFLLYRNQNNSFFPNRQLSKTYETFVDNEIIYLLHQDAIEEINHRPKGVSPISVVPKKGNRLRLIVDLWLLNTFCKQFKCAYEGIDTVVELVELNGKLVKGGVQSGFHHISIRPSDRTFFGFSWKINSFSGKLHLLGGPSRHIFFAKYDDRSNIGISCLRH